MCSSFPEATKGLLSQQSRLSIQLPFQKSICPNGFFPPPSEAHLRISPGSKEESTRSPGLTAALLSNPGAEAAAAEPGHHSLQPEYPTPCQRASPLSSSCFHTWLVLGQDFDDGNSTRKKKKKSRILHPGSRHAPHCHCRGKGGMLKSRALQQLLPGWHTLCFLALRQSPCSLSSGKMSNVFNNFGPVQFPRAGFEHF